VVLPTAKNSIAKLGLIMTQLDDYIREYEARFLICARCQQNTGNTNQGHYWSFCSLTGKLRDFHFCCPGDCALKDDPNLGRSFKL